MALKLNPAFPILWRDPASIQFGVESPRVIIAPISEAEERMIAALRIGVSRSGLGLIAAECGATDTEVGRLLARLEPVLLPKRKTQRRQPTVALTGWGPTVDRLEAILTGSGAIVKRMTNPVEGDDGIADIGIIVAHYVVEPALHGYWLRRDIAHIAVIFSDTSVTIGPIVEPGKGPCLYCIQRHRTDADPAWPAIASQLWGQRSPIETAQVSSEAAALTSRLVTCRLAHGENRANRPESEPAREGCAPTTMLHLEAATGTVTRQAVTVHPQCGCLTLPRNEMALDHGRERRMLTMTGAAAFVPG